jgi:anti-sigma factor RsiW
MHAVVKESIEGYLSGSLERAEERAIEAHLAVCPRCREDLRGMQAISHLFGSLSFPAAASESVCGAVSEESLAPSPGFYARVMQVVEARKAAPSFAGLFALDFAFGRRLLVSSLVTLVLVGGFLVSRESGYARGPAPDSILAQQDSPGFDNASASDSMLATLTSYEH